MSAALTFEVLAALRALHTACVGMDLEVQGKRPTEEQYRAVLAGAASVLGKVPAQLAISDRAAYAQAMRRNDSETCCAIERRYDLFGWPPEVVSVGLSAAAAGQDVEAAVEAHLHGEVTS